MSGDGRAGATAPTTTVATDAAVQAASDAVVCDRGRSRDLLHDYDHEDIRAALAAAWPLMLAAWIAGLTGEQLDEMAGAGIRVYSDGEWTNMDDLTRAALTRLGGAHE